MSRRSRWSIGLAVAALAAIGAVAAAPRADAPLVLLVAGLTQDYLEPCGCGGQNAGGLARRVAMIQSALASHPGAVVIDVGDHGRQAARLPLIFRCLARAGVAVAGLSEADLLRYELLTNAATASGVPLTSLPPSAEGQAPPPVAEIEVAGGAKLAVVSVAHSAWPSARLAERCQETLEGLASRPDLRLVVMISHLGFSGTTMLLEGLPEALRPPLVLLATDSDGSLPVFPKLGVQFVPVARRGRSLSIVTVRGPARQPAIVADQLMVLPGSVDALTQSWIDDYFGAERAGLEAQGVAAALAEEAQPESCVGCHEGAVKAWRLHPHGRAVATLEQIGRDVASCLGCHSELFRRQGLKPPAGGDRGVVCATCHDGLADHRKDPDRLPGTMSTDGCRGCHTPENSPRWEAAPYLAAIAAACRGEVLEPLHAAEGDRP